MWTAIAFAINTNATPAAAAQRFPSGSYSAAQPDLIVSPNPPDGPGYFLESECTPGKTLITFAILVSNRGAINTQPINDDHAVTVTDAIDPSWTAGAPLPLIPAGYDQPVWVKLPARPGLHGAHDFKIIVNGKPWFDQYSFAHNSMRLTVTIPPGLCKP